MKKFATVLNGVDLSRRDVGDLFDCPERVGRMLVLEGWADYVEQSEPHALSTEEDSALHNEEVSHSVWQIIDFYRDGRKDKILHGEDS